MKERKNWIHIIQWMTRVWKESIKVWESRKDREIGSLLIEDKRVEILLENLAARTFRGWQVHYLDSSGSEEKFSLKPDTR